VPAGWKDVGQEDEVFLEFGSFWEGKAVEVGVRNADVLSLVLAHIFQAFY